MLRGALESREGKVVVLRNAEKLCQVFGEEALTEVLPVAISMSVDDDSGVRREFASNVFRVAMFVGMR